MLLLLLLVIYESMDCTRRSRKYAEVTRKFKRTLINVSLMHDTFAYTHILDAKTAVHQYVYPIVLKWQKFNYTY